jgi:hypothetical protein
MMRWQDDDQHIDWELVAEAMFHACVRSPIQVDERRVDGEFRIQRYDIDFDSYAEASWVSVRSSSYDGMLALIRLLSYEEPFDTVQAAVIEPGTCRTIRRVELPLRDVGFGYVRRVRGAPDDEVDDIVAMA